MIHVITGDGAGFPHYLVLLKLHVSWSSKKEWWYFPHYLVLLKPCNPNLQPQPTSLSTLFSPSETHSPVYVFSFFSELSTLFSPSETISSYFRLLPKIFFPHYLVLLKPATAQPNARKSETFHTI